MLVRLEHYPTEVYRIDTVVVHWRDGSSSCNVTRIDSSGAARHFINSREVVEVFDDPFTSWIKEVLASDGKLGQQEVT